MWGNKKVVKLKRVLITGAARGLGFEMAKAFGTEGAEIIATDKNEALLESALIRLEGLDIRAFGYGIDVTNVEQVKQLKDKIEKEHGTIDILINNAGVVFGGPFEAVEIEKDLLTCKVNLEGVVIMSKIFWKDVISSPGGHFVNVASAAGFIGLPFGSVYAATKWGVIGFSHSIRQELKKRGNNHVGVTIVAPSYIATGMFEGAKPPLFTDFLTPQEVAAKTLEAVKNNRLFVLEPWLVKITPFLMATMPTKISDAISEMLGAADSMKEWKGR